MSEKLNLIQNDKEERSFKEYIHNVINELKEYRESLYKELNNHKSSLDYLEYLIYLNPDDDELVVVEERQRLRGEIESLEEEKENLRDKILFYGILENANNPEEVVSEYRVSNKIDDAEAEAVLNFLNPKSEELEEDLTVKKEIKKEAADAETEIAIENKAEKNKNENDEVDDEDDEDSLEEIIAGFSEEKKAVFNKSKTSVPISFLEYREKMKKERSEEQSKRKMESLKSDIQKLEKEAEEARKNRDYKKLEKIEKDITNFRKKLWWHLTPEERETLRITEKEERETAERQYKKIMKGSGISGSRGNESHNDSYYENDELQPDKEYLGFTSEIEKLKKKATVEYRKMNAINKRIKVVTDNKKLDILKRILVEKFNSLQELFWHINYLKNEVIKLHNEKEWEKENYLANGYKKEDTGQEINLFNVNIKSAKKTAMELAFDKFGGAENIKERLGLVKKTPIKKGNKKIKKVSAVKREANNNT